MRISNELQKGKAGEYLVCADLILKGFVAFPSEQGLPFDVVLQINKSLLKIQVKTTEKPRKIPQRNKDTYAYIFNVKRHGKNNIKKYQKNEIDLFALVCLDTRQIGYIKEQKMPDTINLRVDNLKGKYYDEKGVDSYLKCIELSKEIKSQTEIAKQLNLHVSQVNRYLKKGFKPYETKARYFSDIERDFQWFENL
jgi:hypothetical protein